MPSPRIQRRHRRGAFLVLAALMMIAMMGFLAFAVDIGYVLNAHTELQRAADSAAIAGAYALIDKQALTGSSTAATAISNARTNAANYGALNDVCRDAPLVDANAANSAAGDIVVGYIPPDDLEAAMTFPATNRYNAIQVRVQRSEVRNGLVPFFFAQAFGFEGTGADAQATAAIHHEIGGFREPHDGGNLGILPYALDEDTWNALLAGDASDSWSWNEATETISAGADGVKEVNLFPQGTGSPGNRGTVDIGGSNNSTADIARQIVEGVSPDDLEHHDGALELDENGELFLNGDTGISAGVKDELESIMGQPRVIPIFQSVAGPGNNATYTIVKFAGVRIMEVKLTGKMSGKKVMIQPAAMLIDGAVPTEETATSYYIYSRPVLVR